MPAIKYFGFFAFFTLFLPVLSRADAENDSVHPKFGFFVDTNYNYGVNQPGLGSTYFSTPARNEEFSINLAVARVAVDTDRLRASLALHAGASVYQNYYVMSANGSNGAPTRLTDLFSFIHEANAAYAVSPKFWINAGIWEADLAGESFISSKNLNYTRSLIADASPYFLSGVRARYQTTDAFNIGLSLVNGFQIIDMNAYKMVGLDLVYEPSQVFSFAYHTLWGEELRLKILNNFVAKYRPSDFWETSFVLALGFLKKPDGNHYAYDWTLLSSHRFKLSDTWFLGARLEYFWDKYQMQYITGTGRGFQTMGASINLDSQLLPSLLWRTEGRYLKSMDGVFAGISGNMFDSFTLLTSLAVTLL